MPAIIKCEKDLREQIKTELLENVIDTDDMDEGDEIDARYESSESSLSLINWMDGYPEIAVTETAEGLAVDFPIGELYGDTWSYLQEVLDVFRALKMKYPGIGIQGLCYSYETVSAYTSGFAFKCDPEDEELSVIDKWQKCAVCGKIVDSDTFYNSGQWEIGEGDLNCICCPTCMLEYLVLGPSDYESEIININDSWAEEWNDEEEPDESSIREYFWSKIAADKEKYLPDFVENKERIIALADNDGISVEKRAVLLEIIEMIRNN